MGYTHGHRWTEGEVESRIAEVMGQSQIAIGVNASKYDRYREGWKLIQAYTDMVMSFKA